MPGRNIASGVDVYCCVHPRTPLPTSGIRVATITAGMRPQMKSARTRCDQSKGYRNVTHEHYASLCCLGRR